MKFKNNNKTGIDMEKGRIESGGSDAGRMQLAVGPFRGLVRPTSRGGLVFVYESGNLDLSIGWSDFESVRAGGSGGANTSA